MSGDGTKDDAFSPRRYAELGVGELAIFDPTWPSDAERADAQRAAHEVAALRAEIARLGR